MAAHPSESFSNFLYTMDDYDGVLWTFAGRWTSSIESNIRAWVAASNADNKRDQVDKTLASYLASSGTSKQVATEAVSSCLARLV